MPSRLSAHARARQQLVIAFFAIAIAAATILPFVPALPAAASSTPTLLGEQNFYTLDTHQLWDAADLAVNVASGDLIFHDTVFQMAGFAGHNLDLDLYYNSLSNGAGGGADFGSDWVMTAGGDVKLTIGTSITYQGPSSFQQVFTGTAPNWTAPAGMDATLYGPNGSSQYTLTYHDNGQVLTFNSSGQLISNADRNGNTFTYAYNTGGTLSKVTDASGRTVSFNYGGNGNVSTLVDNTESRTYTFTINGSHNLTDYADPANSSDPAVFSYDTSGHHELVGIKDPAAKGNTTLTYDSSHRVTEIQYANNAGGTYNRTYVYNSGTTGSSCASNANLAGNTVVSDENNNTITYCWDSSGRVIQEIDGLGHSTFTTWNSDNKPLTIQDANGNTTTYAYTDSFAPNENLTEVQQPNEGTTTGATTTYTYGASTNHYAPTKMVQPDGTTFTYTYDANGNPSTMTNGMPSANKVTYVYLTNGELYGTLDAYSDSNTNCGTHGPATQCFGYDSNGALDQAYNPSPETTDSYVNDAASRVQSHTDGSGNITTYQYDGDNRLQYVFYAGTTTCTSWTTCTEFQYDADGNLLSMSDSTGTSTYTYDDLNRPLTESESGSSTTTYTHDGVGNLTSIENGLGSSNIIHYGYDAANHLTSLWLGSSTSTCAGTLSTCTTFTVDYDGNRIGTAYPSSLTLNMRYDASDRLYQVFSQNGSGNLTNWSYTYPDPASQDTNLRYSANQSVSPTSSWSNSYDPMDNLSQSQNISYAYNGAAELCGSTCGGSGQTMSYDTNTALSSWNSFNYGYDHNGNMTGISGGGANVTMTYNAQNQLSEECNGGCTTGSTTYTYRGLGQADRASATGVDGTQAWTSDLLGVSTETNTQGVGCTCYYVHDTAGQLVEEILTSGSNAGTYYPIFDGEGSVVALTNSSATVVDTFNYSALGVTTSSTGSIYEPWQFQGDYADNSQSGQYQLGAYQYHNGARFYEAGQMNGHFSQPDPLTDPFDTQGWNNYDYAGGDTANLSDENGLFSCDFCGRAVRSGLNWVSQNPARAGIGAVCGSNSILRNLRLGGSVGLWMFCGLISNEQDVIQGIMCLANHWQGDVCRQLENRHMFCTTGQCLTVPR